MSIRRKLRKIAKLVYNETKSLDGWVFGHGDNLERLPETLQASIKECLSQRGWENNVVWAVSPLAKIGDHTQTYENIRICVSWNPEFNHVVRVFVNDKPLYPVFYLQRCNNNLFGGWSWRLITRHYDVILDRLMFRSLGMGK